jgi:hypothetical protein
MSDYGLSKLAINSAPATTNTLIATGIISCPAFEALSKSKMAYQMSPNL